jgi:hypothetical protein
MFDNRTAGYGALVLLPTALVALTFPACAQVSVFPPQDGSTSHTITADEASMVIDTLALPDGYTLKVGPGVTSIHWTVSTIRFGHNTTFDLTPGSPPKPPGQAGNDIPGAPDYGVKGATGGPGHPGPTGDHGVDLLIDRIQQIQANGTLWIRTDGQNGGAGGAGGRGQLGGGAKAEIFDRKRGGDGGNGGVGGTGGNGGRTSIVELDFADGRPSIVSYDTCANVCGASSRPGDATDTGGSTLGTIVIWGGPGCPGAGGVGGLPGPGGMAAPRAGGGGPGAPGSAGAPGQPGVCGAPSRTPTNSVAVDYRMHAETYRAPQLSKEAR